MTMRLSDAIRLGAMLRPQVVGYWFSEGGSCAIGAAMEAVGVCPYEAFPYPSLDRNKIPRSWEWSRLSVECPANCGIHDQVQSHMRHLNNEHRWTREAIADWVSTIEPQDVPVQSALCLDAVTEDKS